MLFKNFNLIVVKVADILACVAVSDVKLCTFEFSEVTQSTLWMNAKVYCVFFFLSLLLNLTETGSAFAITESVFNWT